MNSECVTSEEVGNKLGTFIVFKNKSNYKKATSICRNRSAILAPVKTQEFKEQLVKLLQPCGIHRWFVGLKLNNKKRWSDETAYDETKHLNIQNPPSSNGEHVSKKKPKCVVLYNNNDGVLERSSCSKASPFVCFNSNESINENPDQDTANTSTTSTQNNVVTADKNSLPKSTSSKIVVRSTTTTTTTTTTNLPLDTTTTTTTNLSLDTATTNLSLDTKTTESDRNKASDVSKKMSTSKTTPKVSITSTAQRRTTKRTSTIKRIVTSSDTVTSSTTRTYGITSQYPRTTVQPSNDDTVLMYSLIGAGALLLLIFMVSLCLWRKSKKKKKKYAESEAEMRLNELYQPMTFTEIDAAQQNQRNFSSLALNDDITNVHLYDDVFSGDGDKEDEAFPQPLEYEDLYSYID